MSFTKLDGVRVFEGHVFDVEVTHWRDPQGEDIERAIIRHPGAVAVVALDEHNRAVLVRQFRAAMEREVLEIPAGTRDVSGEPAELTARRELAEEAGYEAGSLEPLVTVATSPGVSDQITEIFLARALRPCPTTRHGAEEEAMTVELVDFAGIDELIASEALIDATSIVGLERTRRKLGL